MKRTCLISSSLALFIVAPGVAAAAEPGILYLPTEEVTVLPSTDLECSGVGSPNSAANCSSSLMMSAAVPPYGGDVTELVDGLQAAINDFDVMITDVRPPEYISYLMMLPEAPLTSLSAACSFGGINCGARKRNGIVFLVDGTINCVDPEIVQTAVYALGRSSGLEGVANPLDVMNFPPDFTMPVTTYLDECSFRARQFTFDEEGVVTGEANLECTSLDHTSMCEQNPEDDDAPGQNSYQDMLDYYGTRTEDTEAPVLANVVPEDGSVIASGEDVLMDVDITDADPIVGVRWVISSPALMKAGIEGGAFSQCTNDVCDANWDSNLTEGDWSFTLAGLPAGEYTITLEAADYHGNIAEMVTSVVTIEADTSGTGGPGDTGMDETAGPVDPTNASGFTSGDDSGDESGGSNGSTDDGGGGCSCSSGEGSNGTPAAMLTLLGFMGLGAMRRRR